MAGHYHQTQLLTADKVWDKIDFIGLLLDNPLDDVAGLPAGQAVRLQQVPDSRHSLMLGPESHSEEHLAPGCNFKSSQFAWYKVFWQYLHLTLTFTPLEASASVISCLGKCSWTNDLPTLIFFLGTDELLELEEFLPVSPEKLEEFLPESPETWRNDITQLVAHLSETRYLHIPTSRYEDDETQQQHTEILYLRPRSFLLII